MAVFLVIPPGDIALSEPDPVTFKRRVLIVSDVAYVRQKISTRLKFFLGEWFLDQREGVPYYRDVFVKNPDVDLIRSIFKAVILSVQEVASVTRLVVVYVPAERILAVEFDAKLVAGGVLVVRQPDVPFIIKVQRTA